MAGREKYTPDKTINTLLPDREESANGFTSEGASSVDDTGFKDHEFKVPAVPSEKECRKRSKKRKHFELEEKDSDYVVPDELEIKTCSVKNPVQNVSECPDQDEKSSSHGLKAKSEDDYKNILSLYCLNTNGKPRRVVKSVLGFSKSKMLKKAYDEMFYELPPGVGTPPEEVEDIPDELLCWPRYHQYLKSNGDYTMEEVAAVIEERIEFLLDYFQRLEEGKLTKEERQNGKKPPENFWGPYLPTPKHLKKLRSLDIEINWPLSELHEICLRENGLGHDHSMNDISKINKERGRNGDLNIRVGPITNKEAEILVKNWFKFQKEYKFYDIRPLLDIKCARLFRQRGSIRGSKYYYVTRETVTKFILYLMQGLPDRDVIKVYNFMRDAFVKIQGSEFKNKGTKRSLFDRYGIEYIMRKFGADFDMVELLLGDHGSNYYRIFFSNYVSQENIPMRAGPWLPSEMKRLEKGILTVLGINSLKEATSRKISWPKVLPFVRTRPINLYFRQFKVLLRQQNVIKKTVIPFSVEKQLIESMYESGVEFFEDINWDDISKRIPNYMASDLKKHVRYLTLTVPICCRKNFGDTLEYLYKYMDERYRLRNGLTDRKVSLETTEDEDFPDNFSIMSDTTYMDDLGSDFSDVNELFE